MVDLFNFSQFLTLDRARKKVFLNIKRWGQKVTNRLY